MELTHEQQHIVQNDARSQLVVAGAGTGKSTTLIAYLKHKQLQFGRTTGMVVITYTNEAAHSLRLRLGPNFKPHFCGTLHAWALSELNSTGGPRWSVIDDKARAEILAEEQAAHRYKGAAIEIERAITDESISSAAGIVAKAYRERLRAARCLDFDLILWQFREHLRNQGSRFYDVLAVDEYQDTSPIDAEIYSLTHATDRLFVGDPDQAIYGFRGASIDNILSLAEHTEVARLETNWRSTPQICTAANHLISYNRRRLPKILTAGNAEATGAITVAPAFDNELREAEFIAAMARAEAHKGRSVGILARTNAAIDLLRIALPEANAEAQKPVEINILMSALSALLDPQNEIAASTWLRHFAAATTRFKACAEAQGMSPLAYALKLVKTSAVAPTIARLRAMKVPQAAITWAVRAGVTIASTPQVAHQECIQAMTQAAAAQSNAAPIEILTFHGAKGREWDHVFIAAAEADITPGQKTGDELEEERRLFFVALTRARRFVTITRAAMRKNAFNGTHEAHTATRFIGELHLACHARQSPR